jgi:peroxiredoxin
MVPIVFGMVLPWLLVAVQVWLVYQLVRQNGRILIKLEDLERKLGSPGLAPAQPVGEGGEQGLAIGTPAPEFTLPDLDGRPHSLAEFRGKKVLLAFFGPRCGYCHDMLPELAKLPRDGRGGLPVPLVVSSGGAEENRSLFAQHDVSCPILLQKEVEVAAKYDALGTPMGYLIDEEGKIASPLAIGSAALIALMGPRAEANGRHGADAEGAPAKSKAGKDGSLARSKLVRDGLKAGTYAPSFRLPRLDGVELGLDEFRGRRVLLVFSDPNCGPCEAVTPFLERVHRTVKDVQVLMISRLDRETNRKKVAELGLTFPVVLQKRWEVSQKYGMFATPIAYLIDERGIIARDVAVGADAIERLVPEAAVADGVCLTAP